jgi:WD40 repeat protein
MSIFTSSEVYSVAFSPDGTSIVSGLSGNSVQVWDAAMGEQLKMLKGHSDLVSLVSFSPDGTHIVSGSVNNSVWV